MAHRQSVVFLSIAPTGESIIDTYGAVMARTCRNSLEYASGCLFLIRITAASTLDSPIHTKENTRAQCVKPAKRGSRLSKVIPAPTVNGVIRSEATAVGSPSGDSPEWFSRGIGLSVIVGTPALDQAVITQTAGMPQTCGNLLERTGGHVQLS